MVNADGGLAAPQPVPPDWLDRRLFPYESRFISIDGARVHYVDEGDGPVLLLAHGNPTWSFLYRHVIERLSGRFRTIAWDHPGFGLSTAPPDYGFRPRDHARIASQLIEALDLHDITLMIQDWGGPIALDAALDHVDRMRALVVGNTMFHPVDDDRFMSFVSRRMDSPFGRFLNVRLNFFPRFFVPMAMKRKPDREVRAMYRAPFATRESRHAHAMLPGEILRSHDFLASIESRIGQLTHLPILVVWPDRDPGFKERHLRRWLDAFPDHALVRLEGVGHYIQEEAPDEIADAITSWWPGPASAPRSGGTPSATRVGGA